MNSLRRELRKGVMFRKGARRVTRSRTRSVYVRPKATLLCYLAAFLVACTSVETRRQDQWAAANKAVVRLPPTAFARLPDSLRLWLDARGFVIPQSSCGPSPHNVVAGEFLIEGQIDWIVLGSTRDSSEILVFPRGSPSAVLRLERRADLSYLQGNGEGGFDYSRWIMAADSSLIAARYAEWDSVPPIPIHHSGIEDYFCDKGSVVHYWLDGTWHELPGSD